VTSAFTILPAIDLRAGRVVRLEQGDFARETSFSDDPVGVALGFVSAGARWVHLVDLDGARSGESANGAVVAAIVDAVRERAWVEVAGGLRSDDAVARTLAAGAGRVVVGTVALTDPGLVGRLVARHGADRVAVAIDVRDGLAVGHGWSPTADGIDAGQAIRALVAAGVRTFEVTAIDRDGLLGGPDLRLYGQLLGALGADATLIASAGIASIHDLEAVRAVGCAGAIVGRALYDGSLDLAGAITAMA
jgi:phosphoribosylformimino-5-aminoimidazole carboxamide ribotide isomerase